MNKKQEQKLGAMSDRRRLSIVLAAVCVTLITGSIQASGAGACALSSASRTVFARVVLAPIVKQKALVPVVMQQRRLSTVGGGPHNNYDAELLLIGCVAAYVLIKINGKNRRG